MKNSLGLLILCYFFAASANAEIYKDFLPNDSLASIKQKYPNATFEPIKAAWVKEDESFVRLSGIGISGTINLKFSTSDWLLKGLIKDNQNRIDKNPDEDNTNLEAINKSLSDLLSQPLEQKLVLDWLRWVPVQPIPFERLVSKYGSPEKCDFDSEDFRPYCAWPSKGVNTNLSDDKKFVFSIEYTFTDSDRGLKKPDAAASPKPEVNSKPETKPSNKAKKKAIPL